MKTSVKRRPFGDTGLFVSEVSLGAMNLRLTSTREEAEKTVDRVLDLGINLIDTAFAYTGVNPAGENIASEDIVGTVIERRRDIDEPIVIITKNHGYTPDVFDEEFRISCERLRIRKEGGKLYIGTTEIKLVVFFHGIMSERWETTKSSGSIDHVLGRIKNGDLTYLGFSAHYGDGDTIREAIETGAFKVMELPYNVFNRSIGEDGKFDCQAYAKAHGMAVINMKTFNGNSMVPMSRIINDVCSITYADMLRFVLSDPNITTCDCGAKYAHEFEEDVRVSLLPPLTPDERAAMKATADRVSGLMNGICRECMHCMEKFSCPQGINFPVILGNYSRLRMAESLGKDTQPYIDAYRAMPDPRADACVACGSCLEWCEYHLDIPAELAKVRERMQK